MTTTWPTISELIRTPARGADGIRDETRYTYDARNLRATETLPGGLGTTTYDYDPAGNLILKVEQDGVTGLSRTSEFDYDLMNRLEVSRGPEGFVTSFDYDAVGNVIEQKGPFTDASGNPFVTTMTYDAANRLRETEDPLGRVTTHSYDAAGNLLTVTDARGLVTEMTYDGVGRQTSINVPSGRRIRPPAPRKRNTSLTEPETPPRSLTRSNVAPR